MTQSRCELFIAQFQLAEEKTLQVAADFPNDRWFLPVSPDKAHANWLFGHLTHTLNNAVLNYCFGKEWVIGAEWGEIYGPAHRGGKAPSPNPDGYLSIEEITENYSKSMARVVDNLKNFNDEALDERPVNLPSEISNAFQTTARALSHIVMHDAYHRGQIVFLKTKE